MERRFNQMADKKIIAVLGATGAQGGGLARAILSDQSGEFSVRALTRNADSDKAKALQELGADVVEADIDSLESLEKAFQGAHGVYAVTFFWEHFSPEKEKAQVELIAKAAKGSDVNHVVWSTLEDTRKWIPLDDDRMPTLMEKYKVPHFDAKGEANQIFADHGVPTTNLLTSFYWDNMISFGMGPKRGEDGKLTFAMPMGDKKLPGMAAEDIGKCAYGVFKNSDLIGKTVGITGEHLTGAQMAASLERAFGEEVGYFAVPFDMYRSFDFPGADDLGNMFQFKHDFEEDFCGARSIEFSKSLNSELQTLDTWLDANKDKIPVE
jgi:uncharacterized protein YbjT (DUF2867 family)